MRRGGGGRGEGHLDEFGDDLVVGVRLLVREERRMYTHTHTDKVSSILNKVVVRGHLDELGDDLVVGVRLLVREDVLGDTAGVAHLQPRHRLLLLHLGLQHRV